MVTFLPEYVVPFMIHLLSHDPDFTKPQEYDQLKDIKECVAGDTSLCVFFFFLSDRYRAMFFYFAAQVSVVHAGGADDQERE